jgi:hypothetical protein
MQLADRPLSNCHDGMTANVTCRSVELSASPKTDVPSVDLADRYREITAAPHGNFRFPTGALVALLGFDPVIVDALSERRHPAPALAAQV